MNKPIPGVRLALLVAATMVLTHCGGGKEEEDSSSVVSCDKIEAHGVCEEFVNQNPEEIREYGCRGGSFAPSSCPQEGVIAKCETQRGYSEPDQSKVYYYYHLTEGYTIDDLRGLCDSLQGGWIEY